jgi:hypothetical protein
MSKTSVPHSTFWSYKPIRMKSGYRNELDRPLSRALCLVIPPSLKIIGDSINWLLLTRWIRIR